MEQTLSYVLVTPYTVAKSRTGGVVSRLLSRLDLELVGAQMIAPDETLVRSYADRLREQNREGEVTLLADYVERRLKPSEGRRHRTLLLLFRGENPCEKLAEIVGHIYPEHQSVESITGETIRDTYADLITAADDPERMTHFEPAVMTPRNQAEADGDLKLFARFLKGQNNLVENMAYPDSLKIQRTLVIIKPDNWTYASSKPGTIIDMFSRTGLRIIGIKVHRFSLAEALDFYGPVEDALTSKLAPLFGKKAREILEREFHLVLGEPVEKMLAESFGVEYARDQFHQIIQFMSGCNPKNHPLEHIKSPGMVKCMILVYEGENAVQKIRDVLGPTDPLKAPGGTVRREFGSNVMVNTAHASDSSESYAREKDIVKVEENSLLDIVDAYLALR
ncbi:MAG: nucleoside-diphosphate kinase [Spirochaetaceae bacterium]|jgi:nucleoside diphosphate kinase|nr:nucleoside-diphosphate kinase [Spirochaetaceae bacterium]